MDKIDPKTGAGLIGASAVACAACRAGSIIGFIAAASITAVLGMLVFGTVGLAAALGAGLWMWRRRQRRRCPPAPAQPVPIDAPRLAPKP